MGFKILLLLTASVWLASAASTRDELLPPADHKAGQEVDWYDCEGKTIGNYEHPHECTIYIACASGNRAFEMPCAECTFDPVRCPDGRTHYNEDSDQCLWADEAGCSGKGPSTTTRRTTTTTTTQAPEPTTPDAGTGPTRPTPGDKCDTADDCELDGWCHWYDWCDRVEDNTTGKIKGKDGIWRTGECSEEHNMYFNPNKTEHGGICDFWYNLTPDMQHKYNNDPACIDPHCEWSVDPDGPAECAHTYRYFHPDRYDGKIVTLECSTGLVWSQDLKNCVHCSAVVREDGNSCCEAE